MVATGFRPGPYPVQFIHKRYSLNPGVHLSLFADDTCTHTHTHESDRKEGYMLRKLQRGLTSVES